MDEINVGPDHSKVALRLNNLAQLFQATNRLADAEPLLRRALAIDEKHFGSGSSRVIATTTNLALLLSKTGRLEDAEEWGFSAAKLVTLDKLRSAIPLPTSDFSKVMEIYEHILQLRGKSRAEIAEKLTELDAWAQAEIKQGGTKQ
ncbi:MAG: tetratricopeptide repeat protein [Prosthecobacter sp.]